jgi:hypothetical protein
MHSVDILKVIVLYFKFCPTGYLSLVELIRLYIVFYNPSVDRDRVVGIATRYGLDGPGTESRWGARFTAPVQTGPGARPVSYTMGTGSFPGLKRRGVSTTHPSTSSKVKERVELYLYSPSGFSWPILGRTLKSIHAHYAIPLLRPFLFCGCTSKCQQATVVTCYAIMATRSGR